MSVPNEKIFNVQGASFHFPVGGTGRNKVFIIYPNEENFELRTQENWIPGANGIKDLSVLHNFAVIPDILMIDVMHTVYAGIYRDLFTRMYSASKRFFELAEPKVYLPYGMNRPFRNLKNIMLLKTSEMRNMCLFYGPIILYKFADTVINGEHYVVQSKKAMLTNILLLSSAMICLSSRV